MAVETGVKRVLNVGGGNRNIPIPEKYDGWEQHLLDIVPGPGVDIVMDARKLELWCGDLDGYDAVYCSHNLEHYYAHEVPGVLRGIYGALKPGGFAEIHVPDIGEMMRVMVEREADLYDLAPEQGAMAMYHDMLYGLNIEIRRHGDSWAHRCGFTAARLRSGLAEAGFRPIRTGSEHLDLWAVGLKPSTTL